MSLDPAEPSRQLVVVAREELALYQTLRDAFSDLPGVEVIRDRRLDAPRSPVLERRRGGRVEAELRRAGYAVVKLGSDPPWSRSRSSSAGS
jgi:hypothetical protein